MQEQIKLTLELERFEMLLIGFGLDHQLCFCQLDSAGAVNPSSYSNF